MHQYSQGIHVQVDIIYQEAHVIEIIRPQRIIIVQMAGLFQEQPVMHRMVQPVIHITIVHQEGLYQAPVVVQEVRMERHKPVNILYTVHQEDLSVVPVVVRQAPMVPLVGVHPVQRIVIKDMVHLWEVVGANLLYVCDEWKKQMKTKNYLNSSIKSICQLTDN